MKITITNYNKTYSVETDEDVDAESMADKFKGLMVSMGYHPCNVDELFNTEYRWFTQEEIENNTQGHLKVDTTPCLDAFKKGYNAREFQEKMYDKDDEEYIF
jgi:Tat protein secretion system quality control protein TatD with DNase activity